MYVLIVSTIFTALATICVALRLGTRFWLLRAPGLDDLFITCALIVNFAFYAFVLVERRYGLGKTEKSLPPYIIEGQLHYLWLSIPFYNLTLVFAKISCLWLFVRLFRPRPFLMIAYITMGCLVIAGLWMTISGFFFCNPVRAFWSISPQVRSDKCLSASAVWFTNAGIQIGTDLVILILPMPLIWKLHMPRRQKYGVLLCFGLGIFVIATSSARLSQLAIMLHSNNFTKTNAQAAVWSSLEANISIICACLPPLHPLVSRVFSFCFLPQPLHSSPGSKATHSHTTQLTDSRKPSIYSHYGANPSPDGGIWYNELFNPGPASYSASIAKVNTNETDGGNEDGIRVVRELRMRSEEIHTPILRTGSPHERDLEMGTLDSCSARGEPSIEWDLGDFEFPDYKERMNAPI
ncbi:uncharacterized protein N7511_004519 [Penicillium nucicola]|uniref:uncharacterized protein n=1 Tax=Penicillium nucicola TaxID=1850975 RepID=UPI002545A371|nr:uncharacterized protein N7511_004519 [Penicillium nucicola]KAJ5766903.1 hypothetical protein N7511_004519 [Penicillium nucicola]